VGAYVGHLCLAPEAPTYLLLLDRERIVGEGGNWNDEEENGGFYQKIVDDHVRDRFVPFLEYRSNLFLEFARLLAFYEVRRRLSPLQPVYY
jgi:hypothetical protein